MSEEFHINKYTVRRSENGDLTIDQVGQTLAAPVLIGIAGILCLLVTILVESEIRYLTGLFAALLVLASIMKFRSYSNPKRIVVYRDKDMMSVSGVGMNGHILAKDIRHLRFWHEAMHATTTGSIIGVGPKVHMQNIMLALSDGREFPIMHLQNHDPLKKGSEEQEAAQLMRMIQETLQTPVLIL